jgi:two-component system NtrC family response regulator
MKVLIIDDEEKIRSLLSKILNLEGFEVFQAINIKLGIKKLEQSEIDIVICDVKLPDGNGVEATKIIKDKFPLVEVILLTAFGNITDGVQAMKNGAFDYLVKGDDNNKIIPLLYKVSEKVLLSKKTNPIKKQIENKYSFENIIGSSKAILNSISWAKKVALTETNVLLTGETGTGKEIFAQAIHQGSSRQGENFVAINCSAFSKDLLENELFGHKAGAFTGAIKDQRGLFQQANNGTIFLDEIGEMPIDLQAKFLRVLESGEFLRVGDPQFTKVNVRIIAATNRDLEEEISKQRFRSDLFYRLSVFTINLPSLSERKNDIPLLAEHFLKYFSNKTRRYSLKFSLEYLTALENNNWKGNIRELKNVIERSVILADADELGVETLPVNMQMNQLSSKKISNSSLANVEKLHIQKILNYTDRNKAETARILEIGIATLYRKIEEYKI